VSESPRDPERADSGPRPQDVSSAAGDLALAEERYRTLFETLPHGVVYQDAGGSIIAANPAAREILGLDADAIQGRDSDDPAWQAMREDGTPFPGEEHPAMVALRTGQVVRGVVMGVARPPGPERRWIRITAVPEAGGPGGGPRHVYTMFSDITEERRAEASLRESALLLERLRDTNVLGMLLADAQHVYDANDAFLDLIGASRDDLEAGRIDWRTITPPEWADADRAGLAELAEQGACRPFEKEYYHRDGHRVPVLLGAATIARDPLRWVTFVVDLSERQRGERERAELLSRERIAQEEASTARERLSFLLRAGALAGATLDPDELLRHAAELIVPTLADWCAGFLPDEAGVLRLRAGAHRLAGLEQDLHGLRDRADPPGPGSAVHTTFVTGGTTISQHLGAAAAAGRDAWLNEVAGGAAGSLLAVPLKVAGRQAGVLALAREDGRERFSSGEIDVVEELGRRVAVGLGNAEDFAREHDLAETLQRSVLPVELPALPRLELAVRYLPATAGVQVGGDWYDAFPLGRTQVGLVIGDVVGHDVGAALVMGQVRNALRAYAVDHPDPATVLARTNRALARLLPAAMATVIFAVLDSATGGLTYANAGHPPLLHVAATGSRYLEDAAGLMLGVDEAADYSASHRRLAAGDALLLYTDGLVEDRGRDIAEGLRTLAEVAGVAGTPVAMCDAVEAALLGAATRADDVCLLACRLREDDG
jgi:PAS domain S-box-containing protein